MIRLIKHGLMYGNLFPVTSPALVDRYNRALKHLTGKTTELTDFHIDISGFSPEIGDELGDDLYLNPNGCNRQFILLSTDQKTAPLLDAHFSTSRGIMRQFITENEAQLFALTARDAVAGELFNSVYSVDKPEKLFSIRRVRIEADTTGGLVADARKLDRMIANFRNDADGWWDDVKIANMITLAKTTGDVTRNPIALARPHFEQNNMWTSHFGGLYIFRDLEHPAAIAIDKEQAGEMPIPFTFGPDQRNEIAHFFELNDLVEPIVKTRSTRGADIIRQKMEFILVDVAANAGEDISDADAHDLRRVARRFGHQLPEEFHLLADLLRWAEGDRDFPHITSEHPAYFYTIRAQQGPNTDLVNMLLAELTPLDVRQLFICHKQAFYAAYAGWSEPKKTFVADYLARAYASDKAAVRHRLFDEVDVVPPAPQKKKEKRDIIDLVGPWGAVPRPQKKRRRYRHDDDEDDD